MDPSRTSEVERPEPATPAAGRHHIIVGLDFSELSDRALLEGVRLCLLYPDAELHVITVAARAAEGLILPGDSVQVLPVAEAREVARARVDDVTKRYFATQGCPPGLTRIAVYVVDGSPAERIVALASGLDADVIVIGTHARRGLAKVVLGSVAQEVVKRAPCGVFVLRPRDFVLGEKVPAIQPPLQPGEHALLPFREAVTYHYVDRLTQGTERIMPAI